MPVQASERYLSVVDRLYWRLRPGTLAYFRVLDRIHRYLMPRTYLEIGVSTGGSMTLSLPGARNIGVDPEPRIALPLTSSTTIFRETSDDFFASQDLTALLGGMPLDLAFIDGMHHYEFALRDFINIEGHATSDTVVLVHDCYPIDEVTASRDRTTALWSGDVWKMILCLKEQRPDLSVSVVDVGPTGLGVITGLDSSNRVLDERLAEIVAHYDAVGYDRLAHDKAGTLNRVSDDWGTVRSLLPARPFRSAPLTWLVTQRWMRANWSAAKQWVRRPGTAAPPVGAWSTSDSGPSAAAG